MKASLALAVVLLLGIGCDRNRASTCVSGASSPCTCATGATGAQTCQEDGTFAACQCLTPPVVVATPDVPVAVAPVAVVTPDVPVVAPAPIAAAPVAPTAPRAPSARPTTAAAPTTPTIGAPSLGLPTVALPNVMPTAAAPTAAAPTAAAPTAPTGSTAPNMEQLGQLGQLVSQGLSPQQIQSVTNAITSANRSAAPQHPTFSPTELTRLTQMATQQNAGPSSLQSAAQSMLGGGN